ncbi:MAG: hypothetical protein E4H32_05290, partial [Nitrospirales bacterium]
MPLIPFTDCNESFQSTRILMKRLLPFCHFSTFIAIGAFLLCLLVPLTSTPASSSDMAMALSSYSQSSHNHMDQPHHTGSPHSEDILAALTIYLEARGESFAGKMAVAAVIRNRMHHKYHSDGTVKGTVLRAKQFEPWIGRSPEEVRFNPNNR